MNLRLAIVAVFLVGFVRAAAPLSSRDEQATFRTRPGWRVELVAAEPDVVDPVALAFDEHGRLYVAEMRGYPNAGVATGESRSGRIKRLEDRDGDGVYESATVFADGLRFPTSVMPWRGGLIVADAPDLLFIDATGKRRVLYTGFALDNIQQLLNGLQLGLDGWVHAIAGNKGGDIRCPERPELPPVALRGRGIRFKPDEPGRLEPTSGGGQFGLATDEYGNWFTATNSQHLRHIVLPDHALRRNPFLAVPMVTHDIPDHGAACQVFRISPFEAWRVERTTRRAGSAEAKNFPKTELVPGGFITSACSPLIANAESFVCDPANNLIHRDRLEARGATFVARRADDGCEFLASTDNWFRPVALSFGPDGAIYVLDFYREAIETPLSLPEDIKAKMNLASRDRGRIWRLVREGAKAVWPAFATADDLARGIASQNAWERETAHRLLIERQNVAAVPMLTKTVLGAGSAGPRLRALAALCGLDALSAHHVITLLGDVDPNVRRVTLAVCEASITTDANVRKAAFTLTNDSNPGVRFQLALALGASPDDSSSALAELLRRDANDPWIPSAALSSARGRTSRLITAFGSNPAESVNALRKLAELAGAEDDSAGIAAVLSLVARANGGDDWPAGVLDGLGQGMRNGRRSLQQLWANPPPELTDAARLARPLFVAAAAKSDAMSVRLLAYAPPDIALSALSDAIDPKHPPDVQTTAVKSLAAQAGPKPAEILIDRWDGLSPVARREAVEVLCSRPERIAKLLDAVADKRLTPGQFEPARRDQLMRHPNATLRARAKAVLSLPESNRTAVVASYRVALDKRGDATRGHALFKQHCATCHKFDKEGYEVGPDLRSVLGTKPREAFLNDLLDPNREVDPRYVVYQLTTKAGRSLTGILAAETATSVTLRRAGREEDTVLRSHIDEMQASARSLMPEEFEKLVSPQDVADLLAYLIPAKP